MEYTDEKIEFEAINPDLDFIIQAVTEGEKQGLKPHQILDEQELETYQEFIENDRSIPEGHYDNLVDSIDPSHLKYLATEITNYVTWDEDTRRDWSEREKEGIRLLGVSDRVSGGAGFPGASKVVHPLLVEAVVQFHSRALSELWPPDGPVKSEVLGEKTQERLEQAERVQDYLNYQYTEDMPGAFEEEDALLFRLPLSGSVFKKIYYDPIVKKLCSRMVEPADFIVPFSATDLETATRFTHRYREMYNTVKKKQKAGYYSKNAVINITTNESWDYPEVKEEIDHTEGRERVGQEDQRTTILECSLDLDIKGFEDKDEDGKITGVALPYKVWVSHDDNEVLRIQRNWKPDDDNKNRKVDFTHYRFMPGLGFYGYGLLHLIGGFANSATGSLRALLDAAAFSNLQGGYKSRDSRIPGGDTPLAPGEWREVDSTYDELKKGFFPLPYKEPSETLFKLLGYLDERSQKFVGTTDVMTGDANPNAPVGTTLALIEQGGKSFSAVIRRLHSAHRNEFRILARMNAEYLPEEGYPYYTKSGDRHIFPADFDDRVDVIPVSDPNIISNSQRIVQAQAVLDLAEKHPDKISLDVAIRTMLEAIRSANIDELMVQQDNPMQRLQEQLAQIELQIKQSDLSKKLSEKLKIDAEKTESVIRALFASMQAGSLVATNPMIAPISDEIYKSGGGVDYNGPPIVGGNIPIQSSPMDIPQNTSPGFPALPQEPSSIPPETSQMQQPLSPGLGANAGIETIENEGTLQ